VNATAAGYQPASPDRNTLPSGVAARDSFAQYLVNALRERDETEVEKQKDEKKERER